MKSRKSFIPYVIERKEIEFRHGFDAFNGEVRVLMRDGQPMGELPKLAPPPVPYSRSDIKGPYVATRAF